MKTEYCVYYQTGKSSNFKWHYGPATYTKNEAITKVRGLNRMGYPAHYAKVSQMQTIGLPDTFDSSQQR